MKSLQHHLTEYVAARRALGTRLEEPAQTLRQFVKFLARKKAGFITIKLALEWSQQCRDAVQPATCARKLSMVRQFARWLNAIEPRHQVPPRGLLDVRHRRGKPHIYSDEEITRLMAEAARLKFIQTDEGADLGDRDWFAGRHGIAPRRSCSFGEG